MYFIHCDSALYVQISQVCSPWICLIWYLQILILPLSSSRYNPPIPRCQILVSPGARLFAALSGSTRAQGLFAAYVPPHLLVITNWIGLFVCLFAALSGPTRAQRLFAAYVPPSPARHY